MMSKLTFIGNPWASSIIRGEQVAKRMDRKFINPSIEQISANSNEYVVAVKCVLEKPQMFRHVFFDVIDGLGGIPYYKGYSNVTFIAISEMAAEFLRRRGCKNIVVIPEHHCNFERRIRVERPVDRIGFIGYPDRFGLDPQKVAAACLEAGFSYIHKTSFVNREDVCGFYENIDIQITFGDTQISEQLPPELKNPLKLENAGSFKIPTVGYPEPSYVAEFGDSFLHAYNLNEVLEMCKMLRDNINMYNLYANRAYELAREYHIDKVIERYRRLELW